MMKDLNAINAQIDVKVGELKWSGKLQDIVRINIADLDGDLSQQPSVVSWFGVILAEAIATYEDLKDRKERMYASLYLKYREQDEKLGVKSTEARTNSQIMVDNDYIAHQDKLNDVRRQMNVLKSISVSLDHRRDMLIQLSANIRSEHKAGDYGFDGKE
jgi:hypothetical protein